MLNIKILSLFLTGMFFPIITQKTPCCLSFPNHGYSRILMALPYARWCSKLSSISDQHSTAWWIIHCRWCFDYGIQFLDSFVIPNDYLLMWFNLSVPQIILLKILEICGKCQRVHEIALSVYCLPESVRAEFDP